MSAPIVTRVRGILGSIVIAAGLALAPGIGVEEAAAASVPEVQRYTLENGLDVVVIPDHRAPVVVHMVWYRVGGADEPAGKSGIAHLLEHMMFRGTETVPPGAFSKIVARNGGRENAFTGQDYTGYFQMVAKDRLALVMRLESDRMANLTLNEELVTTERDVVIEERRSRVDNQPSSLLSERMAAVQFFKHPYREPLIGWMSELKTLDKADAAAFYDRYYTPANAILVVAGDVSGDEVMRLAKEHYGTIAGRPVPARARGEEPPQLASRRVRMTSENVTQPSWRRTYLAPSAVTGESDLAVPLEVLSQYLGGGTLSRLYQSLVVRQKLAANAGSWYSSVQRDKTRFALYAVPTPGTALTALEEAVEKEIAAVRSGDINPEDVERAKTLLKADMVYGRDSMMNMARIFGSALAVGMRVDDVIAWPEKVEAVTPADVIAAAKAVFKSENSVTGILLPAEAQAAEEPRGGESGNNSGEGGP